MNHAPRIACLVVALALVPASAEARKMRFGGGKSSSATSSAKPDQPQASRGSIVVLPGLGVSSARAGERERVPFPPSTLQPQPITPAALSVSAGSETKKPWCGSQVVVGGFCVVN